MRRRFRRTLAYAPPLPPVTRYVSPAGADTNSGATTALPWKTLAKAQAEAASLPAGSSILLARGSTFRESIAVPGALTLGAYGTGADPIISGADPVTGTWSAASTSATTTTVTNDFESGAWATWPSVGTDSTNTAVSGTHCRFISGAGSSSVTGRNHTKVRVRMQFRPVTSMPAVANQKASIVVFEGGNWSGASAVRLWGGKNGSGAFYVGLNQSDATMPLDVPCATAAWHDLTVEIDATARTAKLWLDKNPDTTTADKTITVTGTGNVTAMTVAGWAGADAANFQAFVDDHVVTTTDPATTSTQYSLAFATHPYELWLGETKGRYRASRADLSAAGDWSHESGTLWLNSPGGNPATVWASIQAVMRPRPLEVADTVTVSGVVVQRARSATPFAASGPWGSAPGGNRVGAGLSGLIATVSSWRPAASALTAAAYHAAATDPLVSLLHLDSTAQVAAGTWARSGNTTAVETTIRGSAANSFPDPSNRFSSRSTTAWLLPTGYIPLTNPATPPRQIRCPAGAVPAGAKGHMIVVQPDGTAVECVGAIRLSTGEIVCLRYQIVEPWRAGDWVSNGTTPGMLPMLGGLVRDEEARRDQIDHALQLWLGAEALAASWAYPAAAFDVDAGAQAAGGGSAIVATGVVAEGVLASGGGPVAGVTYTGSIPVGTKLALPATFDVPRVAASSMAQAVGRALKDHGAIVMGRGEAGYAAIAAESGIGDSRWAAYDSAIAAELQSLINALEVAS